VDSFPDNPVFERWRGRIAASKSESAITDSVFKNVLKKSEKNLEGYNTPRVRREANYYVGANLKKNGDYDGAFSYYKKCIEDSKKIDGNKESGFRINATLYSGTILEAKGKYNEAKKYYNAVLDMREFKNSHTLAETYLARVDKLEKQGSK